MSYQIDADYSKVFMFPPSFEDFVSGDDPARFIRAFVDSLDLKFLGFKAPVTADGRPRFAPSLLLKIWLFGSFERVHSSRKLERQCRRDVALMWLSGMNTPDHNTLWRFFKDNKNAIKRLFKHSVKLALKHDLVGMVYHAIDGTKIVANASRFKGLKKDEMKLLLQRVDEYVESMAREVESCGDSEPDDRLPLALQDAKELRKRVQENIATLQQKKNGTLSTTDMDSRKMMTNRGTVEFAYNAQAVADEKTGIIVGAEVSQEEMDNHLLSTMLKATRETAGNNALNSVADAGYFSGEEVAKVENPESTATAYVNIPENHNCNAYKTSGYKYHSDNFNYDKKKDVFICPHGCELKRGSQSGKFLTYLCTAFAECPHKSLCTKSEKCKVLTVHPSHEAIRLHKKKIAQPAVQQLLKQRGRLIERVFGWIKEQYGLRRLLSRGLENAKAWWYLACTVYNLRKILFHAKSPALIN
jgi:transposase